jgi:thioredoxin reductase (NADPH)
MSDNVYDCLIIGAGPAGLAAALYSARDRFKTVVLEKFYPGGQINTTDRIENYPGHESISGPDLVQKMLTQATNFGAEIKTNSEVKNIEKLPDGNIKVSTSKKEFISRVVILTPGSDYRKLGVPGEDEFRNAGAGVSYCGTCDAPFFKGKKVLTVGGGNTSIEDTLHLAKFADHVTIVHRRDEFRATKVLVEELVNYANKPGSNLDIRYDTVITSIEGSGKVERAKLKNVKTNKEEEYLCDGVFIFVGMVPNTGFLKNTEIQLSDAGFIKCECAYLRTNVPGVFVAGDCRIGAAMQLATAVGDGVLTAIMMKQYLRDKSWWNAPVADILGPGGR